MRAYVRTNATLTLTALALFAAACREVPVETLQPESPAPAPGDAPEEITGIRLIAAECRGDVRQLKVECGVPTTVPKGITPDIIVGGQNHYVTLTSTNVNYSAVTQQFTFDVTLRNRIAQTMGTSDGTTDDPNGIRVFFHTGPTATSGTGAITVVGDGTATFTNADQPYYRYLGKLQSFQVTSPRTWTLNMPPTVTAFTFTALISAPVQYPDGYIDISGPSTMQYNQRQLAATVRTAIGDPVAALPISWSSSDTVMATVDPAGMATPLRTGSLEFIASSTLNGIPVSGRLNVFVQPITRTWTAGAGTTDWNDNNNWSPAIRPQATDTVVVPAAPPLDPALTANENIGGIRVEDGAFIQLNAFNLTASGDVLTIGFGAITNTTGTLVLTGVARTIGGRVPRIRMTGTYSLSANLTLRAPMQVDAGRLTTGSFRVQADSN